MESECRHFTLNAIHLNSVTANLPISNYHKAKPSNEPRKYSLPFRLRDWSEARKLVLPRLIDQAHGLRLIEGELIELPLEASSLAKTDAWEGFQPGQKTTYQRFIAPALLANGSVVPTWAYGAFQPPEQSRLVEADHWIP